MMDGSSKKGTEIEYPCPYLIKVIAQSGDTNFPDEIIKMIGNVTTVINSSIQPSKSNKYASLSINFILESEAMMKELFDQIKAKPYVKLVL